MAVLTKITTRSLADNAVSSAKIQDGAIAVADVADGSISTAKLADDAVTAAKLASNAVVDASVDASAAIGLNKLATTGALSATTIAANPKATNATTLATTYSSEQEIVHGSTFTAAGNCTVTGDVVLESLTDDSVILTSSGTDRTITGSGGRIIMKGLSKTSPATSSQSTHFTGSVSFDQLVQAKSGINFGSLAAGVLGSSVTLGSDVTQVANRVVQIKYAQGGQQYTGTNNHFGANLQWMGNPSLYITPTKSDNVIFLFANIPTTQPSGNYIYMDFQRNIGGHVSHNISGEANGLTRTGNGSTSNFETATMAMVDDPNTTSEIVYQIQFKNNNNSTSVSLGDGDLLTCILAMEIQV